MYAVIFMKDRLMFKITVLSINILLFAICTGTCTYALPIVLTKYRDFCTEKTCVDKTFSKIRFATKIYDKLSEKRSCFLSGNMF